eukprot:COSAG02_NODE_21175_length_799_cov_0.894286_1_plen_132_part_10
MFWIIHIFMFWIIHMVRPSARPDGIEISGARQSAKFLRRRASIDVWVRLRAPRRRIESASQIWEIGAASRVVPSMLCWMQSSTCSAVQPNSFNQSHTSALLQSPMLLGRRRKATVVGIVPPRCTIDGNRVPV